MTMDVDTIAALSTVPGLSAVAVVRISGPDAVAVLVALLPEACTVPEVRRATLVELRDPDDGSTLDRALVTRFAAPSSYTGEEMVELSCHGGWIVPGLVLDACRRAGAREAEPGEFTRRAYLRGKLDLVQAEAIADVIEARSRAMHRAALHQMERGLSSRIADLRARLLRVEALLAHHVDFPEEDDAPVPLDAVAAEARVLLGETDAMLATAPEGELLREGAVAVLAGRPNAGKSSLYNALVGEDRAIVTEEPGTTRDALIASVEMGGFPFRLVDTAGLRADPGRVEALGIEVARRWLDAADVVLFCVPANEGPKLDDEAFLAEVRGAPVVVVETKADLVPGGGADVDDSEEGADKLRVSVRSGLGLGVLRDRVRSLVYGRVLDAGAETPVLTRRRHADALRVARGELALFCDVLDDGVPAEIASIHLRLAESALEEVVGVVVPEDVLDVVFREFCVGK
jgi:tRNA modification GTPase